MAETGGSRRRIGDTTLWFVLLGGHAAWTLQLLAAYLVISVGCRSVGGASILGMDGYVWLTFLITFVAALIALLAIFVSYRALRRSSAGNANAPHRNARVEFMAGTGILLNVLFFVTILLGATSPALLGLHEPFCIANG